MACSVLTSNTVSTVQVSRRAQRHEASNLQVNSSNPACNNVCVCVVKTLSRSLVAIGMSLEK